MVIKRSINAFLLIHVRSEESLVDIESVILILKFFESVCSDVEYTWLNLPWLVV